jgi:hypothetical protein
MTLFPEDKPRPGRGRAVTAHAWIARRGRSAPWQSHVYAGGRRVHVLSTATRQREKALAFNRCHLLQVLSAKPAPAIEEVQLTLDP